MTTTIDHTQETLASLRDQIQTHEGGLRLAADPADRAMHNAAIDELWGPYDASVAALRPLINLTGKDLTALAARCRAQDFDLADRLAGLANFPRSRTVAAGEVPGWLTNFGDPLTPARVAIIAGLMGGH